MRQCTSITGCVRRSVGWELVQQTRRRTLLACLALFLCHGYCLFSAQTFDGLPRAHANLIGPSVYKAKVDYYSKKKEKKIKS